jgi:4-hydroxy-2-oxoheptanedioate aldolase
VATILIAQPPRPIEMPYHGAALSVVISRKGKQVRITNQAKKKMLGGEPAFGYSLGLGSALAAERMANTGIDFIMIDTQHGSWGPESTIASLMAITTSPATPMARVARNDYTMIGRLLDEGALGIIVPMVHTAEDAKAAADACRFPPTGSRSWGWGRAAGYGEDYSNAINDEILVMVQIESAQAVENAEAILSTPGVDGCWIGPSDLSLSMGIHPSQKDTDERVQAAIDKVLTACKNTGAIPGFAGGGPSQGVELAQRGFRFITCGSDLGFMLAGAADGLKTIHGKG